MESLPHDVIESILERIDAKTLVKFKSVSKLWRSTIQSPYFQQRQLICRQSRGDPDLLLVSVYDTDVNHLGPYFQALRTLSLDSPSVSVEIPTRWENRFYFVCKNSCDGLVYLYLNDVSKLPCSVVVNPTTRWHRIVPPTNYQLTKKVERDKMFDGGFPFPGFGKDKINGIYKLVCLYNSSKTTLDINPTICEVFDFITNSWRYVLLPSPYRILHFPEPVYFDGSLHWFTEISPQGETMVLSFDLHTETFQIISKAPFFHDAPYANEIINILNLDDRLCVSQENKVNQVIWSFDSVHKIWNQIYSIDLTATLPLIGEHLSSIGVLPLGVLGNDKLLLCYVREFGDSLVTFDPKTKSYHLVYSSTLSAYTLCYFPSLFSIL